MSPLNRFLAMPRWRKAGVVGVALIFAVAVSGSGESDAPQILRTDTQGFLGVPDGDESNDDSELAPATPDRRERKEGSRRTAPSTQRHLAQTNSSDTRII